MPRGKRHSEEKRAAVIAALLAGQGVTEVARNNGLDPAVVSRWRARIPATELQRVVTKRADGLSNLIADALTETFKAVAFSLRFVQTAEGQAWIKQHSPSDLAVFLGVAVDKAIRFLEAQSRAECVDVEVPADPAGPVRKDFLQ